MRETSLNEWCGTLHATHKVNLELAELRGKLDKAERANKDLREKTIEECVVAGIEAKGMSKESILAVLSLKGLE